MNLRKYIAASANHSHTLNRTATTVYRLFKFRFYRNLKELKELKLPIFSFARLSALTSNRAKRSDNFYNFLTSSEISNQKLK